MTTLDPAASQPRPVPPLALAGRSITKELDLSLDEWHGLLGLTQTLKLEMLRGQRVARLRGRDIALVFARGASRTPCAFELAARDQGAQVTYLDATGSRPARTKRVRDTGRGLSRRFDGIQYHGFSQASVEELASSARVPVWNGLSDSWRPMQSLGDVFTMLERVPDRGKNVVSFAYVGDASTTVASSLLVAGAMTGMDVRMVGPHALMNAPRAVDAASRIARRTGAVITQTSDPVEGLAGVHFVYADAWVPRGEDDERWKERLTLLDRYRVDAAMMRLTGRSDSAFMHHAPTARARRSRDRALRRTGRRALEVTDEVLRSPRSIALDQAANGLHTAKAVLVATLPP